MREIERQDGRPSEDSVKLAAFRVGEQEYAIDIMRIKEIVHPVRVTRVPKAPPFIEGIIDLRGALLPIVDLRKRFEVPPRPVGRSAKYMNVWIGEQLVGLIVDAVSDVLQVSRSAIRPPPALVGGGGESYLLGVVRHGERMLMILDLERILSSSERLRLSEIGAAVAGKDVA